MRHTRTETADGVRASLRALALGTVPERGPGTDECRRVVADAEAALATVEAACEFAADGGFDRLQAVEHTTRMPTALTERARAVRTTLDRYRAAYRTATAADHFHSGHDTHIPRDEQRRDN